MVERAALSGFHMVTEEAQGVTKKRRESHFFIPTVADEISEWFFCC
jgi:hypothetical protein